MIIDWTVDFGSIITLVGVVGGGVFLFAMMRSDMKSLSGRLTAVENVVGKLSDILVAQASQTARLDSHTQRIDRMERRMDEDMQTARFSGK